MSQNLHPYMIFAINESGHSRLLEIDFIDSMLYVKNKDVLLKKVHLRVTKCINAFRYDEFLIEFRDDPKPLLCQAVY